MAKPHKADIMLVAENPYKYDDEQESLWATAHLKRIKDYFETTGLTVYVSYAVKCYRPKEIKITPTHLKACKEYIDHELEIVQPKHVIVLGASALKSIGGKGNVQDIHGQPIQDDKIPYIIYPTIHQAQAAYSEDNKRALYADLRLFKKWILNGIEESTKFDPPVKMAATLKALLKVEKMIKAHGGPVAVDTETQGLDPYDPTKNIRCLQLCWDVKVGGVFIPLDLEPNCYFTNTENTKRYWTDEPIEEAVRIIRRILKQNRLIWHNGKFDRLWLYMWGKRRFGSPILCPNTFMDTMHVAYLLNENRRLKLKKLLTEEFGFLSYDISDKMTLDLDILIPYSTRDTVATLLLAEKYVATLREEQYNQLRRFYFKVMRPVDDVYTRMELEGWPVSERRTRTLFEQLDIRVKASIDKLNQILAQEHLGPYEQKVFNSPDELRHIIFNGLALRANPDPNISRTQSGELSTGDDALVHLRHHPFVKELLAYRSLFKAWGTYAKPMLLAAETRGKITTSYKLAKVVTGRTASGKEEGSGTKKSKNGMNLQNLPPSTWEVAIEIHTRLKIKRKKIELGIKDCIMLEPTSEEDINDPWWIVEVDFSQIELRIAGELSGDKALIENYASGGDLHTLRAMRILKLSKEEWDLLPADEKKKARTRAKPVNFGYLYGMGWMKFRQFALTDYGVEFSAEEAQAVRDDYFDVHNGLPRWYARQQAQVERLGYVETLDGRRRHLPNIRLNPDESREAKQKHLEAIRMAINSPVQSFGSDLKLMALVEIDAWTRDLDYARLFGEVHDSILLRVRRSRVLEVSERCVNILRHPQLLDELGIVLQIPIDAEAEAGPSLGEKKEVHEWEELKAA